MCTHGHIRVQVVFLNQPVLIRYLKHTEIDKARWDDCIEHSSNSFIYAFSWFLDVASPGWEALVLDDYQAVMPLTFKRKYYVSYAFQPFFAQQLGVFSNEKISGKLLSSFIESIPSRFRLVEIHLNEANKATAENVRIRKRKNYVLPLKDDYALLRSNYNEQARRNLKKASKENLRLEYIKPQAAVDFYIRYKANDTPAVEPEDYRRLKQIYAACEQHSGIISNAVVDGNGKVLATTVFLIQGKRIIFSSGTSNKAGRKNGAMHFMFDEIIKNYSGRNLVLDFEGSELKGVERFYQSFGAQLSPYFVFNRNTLPWLVKILYNLLH